MTEPQQQQRYRVLERLAAGGMAEVFIAESAGVEGFKKRVAIKRILPHLSEKKRFVSMFLDEARLSALLSHSNCVQVFDIGIGDNTFFIVMEFVDGSDLKAVIDYLKNTGRAFPVEIAVLLTVRICEGLTYAHELTTSEGKRLDIVHRDISPPNVLITKHGEVKVVDFGLAKATSQLEISEPGIIKGKFSYLSPEAATGGEVDHRTDIFAVGIILWELLAGKRLFMGDTDFATVKMVQQSQIPSLRAIRNDVPEELERIINRALAKDLKIRYSSARDLGRDLTTFLYHYGKPVSSFDIAELVRGAMAQRKSVKADKSALSIDKLIDEALLEFTSLDKAKGAGAAGAAGKAADKPGGFENIADWINEVNVPQSRPSHQNEEVRKSIEKASAELGIGNLAALEDDEPPALAQAPSTAISKGPPSGPKGAPVVPQAKGPNPIVYVLVVLAIGAAVAGAWFGGLIPH